MDLLRVEGGGSITLDAAARAAGLTKPGLMYHFPTKEALMVAVVDHVAQRWVELLVSRLDEPTETASPYQRFRAYVEISLTVPFDRADFAIYADAHYRAALTDSWVRRIEPWLALPDSLPQAARARLTAARLLADGYWTSAATGVFLVPARDRDQLMAVAEDLLKEETSR